MSKNYQYFRDGDCPQILVRHTYGDGEGLAESWDYKDKKWVPDAKAWEIIEDSRNKWALPEEDIPDYIERMLERFPWLAVCNVNAKPEGAKRVSK